MPLLLTAFVLASIIAGGIAPYQLEALRLPLSDPKPRLTVHWDDEVHVMESGIVSRSLEDDGRRGGGADEAPICDVEAVPLPELRPMDLVRNPGATELGL